MTHETADRMESSAYWLKAVTYLPHYRNDGLFIGPGYPTHNTSVYTAHDLILAGAKRISIMLWPRGKTGVVDQDKV